MNNIRSRFERFAAFAFSAAGSFDKGAELWDTLSHYEFYLTGNDEPNETFFNKLEELGCSRRWLLYASGEMFAHNEAGKVLRFKFMNGVGLANKTFSFGVKSTSPQPEKSRAITDNVETVEKVVALQPAVLKSPSLKATPSKAASLKNKPTTKNTGKKKKKTV